MDWKLCHARSADLGWASCLQVVARRVPGGKEARWVNRQRTRVDGNERRDGYQPCGWFGGWANADEGGPASGLSAIGSTPVVRLAHQTDDRCAEVWVKMEAANPTGSYKDRMALAMIEAAEADGRLRPGQLVVEYTGGSTGSSLAFVCAVKGYPLRIVSSDAFATEKIRTMRAFGAEVELIPALMASRLI